MDILSALRRQSLTQCMQSFDTWSDADREGFHIVMMTGPYALGKGLKLCYECGLERGIAEGQHDMAVMLLEARFGSLSPAVRQRVAVLSPDEVRQLTRNLLRAQSLKDLRLEE